MADLEREPFWGQNKAWSLSDEQETRKVRFENRGKTRSEVIPCDGALSIEFLLALTLPQFEVAYKEQGWTPSEAYEKFGKCLTGDMKVAWEETLDKDYPDEMADRTDANWESAKDAFIKKYLNCKRPRDVQLRDLEHNYRKAVEVTPESHFRRFRESLRNALKLPAGVVPDPGDELLKEWYFRTFCKPHRHAFITSGVGKEDLANSSLEDITEYMRLMHNSDMADGTIATLLNLKKKSSKGSSTRNGGDKPYRRNAHYNKGRDNNRWDRRRDGSPPHKSYRGNDRERSSRNSSRRDDNRHSGRDHSGRDSRRSGRDDKREHRGRGDRKPEFYRSDRKDCKLHKPCAHTYEECSKNPRNARGSSSRRQESHHQDHDESSVASSSSNRSQSSSGSRSSHSADDNYHIHGSWSNDSEEYKIPRRKKKIAKKPKKAKKQPKKVRRRILEDSDSDGSETRDEFAGSSSE